MNERRWNLLAACAVSAIGLIIAGLTIGSWWAMVGLSIAAFGFYGSKGSFWSMPPMFLTGTAAASIAWINSLGNLGGFFGPWYVGVIKDWTDSYAGGLYGLAFLCVMSRLRVVSSYPKSHRRPWTDCGARRRVNHFCLRSRCARPHRG
jgi:ACS family tartrate transporter-like MFS transporter